MKKNKFIFNFKTSLIQSVLFVMAIMANGCLVSCGHKQIAQDATDSDTIAILGPEFSADSAYSFCIKQCAFGPRTMNSTAHEQCKDWIVGKFREYGLDVIEQSATLAGYDGTPLKSTNIIAQYRPELSNRILLCAHWDTRPWADNDPDENNHQTAIDGANDGASGVAVIMELARLLSLSNKDSVPSQDSISCPAIFSQGEDALGIDFICFDAEDWGTPQWDTPVLTEGEDSSWALGAQYWSKNPHKQNYTANYGILLDMVGGNGAHFYHEYFSKQSAPVIINKIWRAAEALGYGSVFPMQDGGAVNDDHCPIIRNLHIPCVDIIPYYPDCEQSSFGPTWHTVNDNMQNISQETLKAVGQTLVQIIWGNEQ